MTARRIRAGIALGLLTWFLLSLLLMAAGQVADTLAYPPPPAPPTHCASCPAPRPTPVVVGLPTPAPHPTPARTLPPTDT